MARSRPALSLGLLGARVHVDEHADAAARALGAEAVTLGRDLFFARGRYAPGSAAGGRLLRHELAHVAQAGGRHVAPRPGLRVADPDHPAEREARGVAEGGALTRLQPRAGPPMVFRHRVAPSPVNRATRAQIFGTPVSVLPMPPLGLPVLIPRVPGMSLRQFKEYTTRQADWFVEPSLTAADRTVLWRLLLLIEEGPYILTGVGDVEVDELRSVTGAQLDALRSFCRGTHSSQQTIRIHNPGAYDLARRLRLGAVLAELERLFTGPVLRLTASELQLADIERDNLLPWIRWYATIFGPHLQQTYDYGTAGQRGPEFQNLIDLFAGGAAVTNLPTLASMVGWIRNPHRFPIAMLNQLRLNLLDTSGSRRLVLVLHTGHDNSAFQASAHLFDDLVRNSPNNLVLMIEGAASLNAIRTRIPGIAATYGRADAGGTRRINQVIIAGHGLARSVELAGTGAPTVHSGAVHYPIESMDLDTNLQPTRDLLDALFNNMDPATARLLYAGCLVGATHVPTGTPSANVGGALAAHQSLGAFTEARGVGAGMPANFVQAARASVGLSAATRLYDPATGDVGLDYPSDPAAFSTAGAYLLNGHEPEGVLLAAVEVGAVSPIAAEHLLRHRAVLRAAGGLPVTDPWWDPVTDLFVAEVLAPVAAGAGIDIGRTNDLANTCWTIFVARWPGDYGVTVSGVVGALNPQPFAASIYTRASALADYRAPPDVQARQMRVILDQSWMALSAGPRIAGLLTGIGATGLHADGLAPWLEPTALHPHRAALLPVGGAAAAPSPAQIRLALAWFSRDQNNAHVRSFLRAQVITGAGPPHFSPPFAVEIAAAGMSATDILRGLGYAMVATTVSPPAGGGAATTLPVANVDVDADAINEILVQGHPYEATVTAGAANIRGLPRTSGNTPFAVAHSGDTLRVVGFSHRWAAIDHNGRLGFIHTNLISSP